MSLLHRHRTAPAATADVTPGRSQPPSPAARTRDVAAWLAVITATVTLVALIIFIVQNTATVAVSFLWMQASLPLATALLITGAGAVILTMLVGVAAMTRRRRRLRRTH